MATQTRAVELAADSIAPLHERIRELERRLASETARYEILLATIRCEIQKLETPSPPATETAPAQQGNKASWL